MAVKGLIAEKRSTGGLNHPMKMVKMVQARCDECNPRGQGRRGWWENCSHDPYFTVEEKEVRHPILEQTEDGRTLKTGETVEVEYHKHPNFKQIADDAKVSSGRMVQIQIERGSVFPEALGYAPICDYNNCWEPAERKFTFSRVFNHEGVQTILGKYHTRDEAAIMNLRFEKKPVYVGMGIDIENRRAQLDGVNLG